jgi:hypothetical protein
MLGKRASVARGRRRGCGLSRGSARAGRMIRHRGRCRAGAGGTRSARAWVRLVVAADRPARDRFQPSVGRTNGQLPTASPVTVAIRLVARSAVPRLILGVPPNIALKPTCRNQRNFGASWQASHRAIGKRPVQVSLKTVSCNRSINTMCSRCVLRNDRRRSL